MSKKRLIYLTNGLTERSLMRDLKGRICVAKHGMRNGRNTVAAGHRFVVDGSWRGLLNLSSEKTCEHCGLGTVITKVSVLDVRFEPKEEA